MAERLTGKELAIPKRKPITENPTYKKALAKIDRAKATIANLRATVDTSTWLQKGVKVVGAASYGWVRGKTRLIDQLPGSKLAGGSIPDLIIGTGFLGLEALGAARGWGRGWLKFFNEAADIAATSAGLRFGGSISALDSVAASINTALPPVSGLPPSYGRPYQSYGAGAPPMRSNFNRFDL